MEASVNQDISQIVSEQGHLLRQHYEHLAQLRMAMDEVLHIFQHLDISGGASPPTSGGFSTTSRPSVPAPKPHPTVHPGQRSPFVPPGQILRVSLQMPWFPTPVLPLFHSSVGSSHHRQVQGCPGYFPADRTGVGVGYGRLREKRIWVPMRGSGSSTIHRRAERTVAASSGWNDPALCTLFRRGLRKEVQTEMAC